MAAYSPNKIVVVAAGVLVGSFQKDAFLTLAYDEPAVTVRKTVQGEAIYSINKTGTVTAALIVEPNSAFISQASELLRRQELNAGGAFSLSVIDNNVPGGQSFFHCPVARLQGPPDLSWGAEAPTYEYTILIGESTQFTAAIPVEVVT